MSEHTPALKATPRERAGSRYAQRVRSAGGLPAVIYGHGIAPVSVTLDAKEALGHIHKGEKVFQLAVAGGKAETVLLRDVQFDYLGTNVIHADFSRVDLSERVHVRAHIKLVGQGNAPGLKAAGALLMHPTTEIELEVEVSRIPDSLEVDVSAMVMGDVLHARDVKLPAGMKLLSDPEAVVAQITEAREAPAAGEAAAAGAAAQPEVITEKKDKEKAD